MKSKYFYFIFNKYKNVIINFIILKKKNIINFFNKNYIFINIFFIKNLFYLYKILIFNIKKIINNDNKINKKFLNHINSLYNNIIESLKFYYYYYYIYSIYPL
ncbi:hypothetical protein C3B56_00059 [Candidatus Annandia adelgestsuga]|uniref:Uncharacterized protein n=1 Tax=Candidatus Annandia adelgestsuga TaxID=1302411 RepID=A0A3Q9CM18_9ENTR|nr:hypothetical protein C3B56_00059 [Candidatus Annandia adelgestsuga]